MGLYKYFATVDLTEFKGEGDLAFMQNEVMRCKTYFDSLVVTTIDKCSQHLHIWLPVFYKEKCIAAFSEESDPTHFQQVCDSEEEAKQFLWTSYSEAV